jgi:hypothetical protein
MALIGLCSRFDTSLPTSCLGVSIVEFTRTKITIQVVFNLIIRPKTEKSAQKGPFITSNFETDGMLNIFEKT